jgi:hypothetical protein
MDDEFKIFADGDPLVATIKRDRARQEEEAAEKAREQEQAEIIEIFRDLLLQEFDAELLLLAERSLSSATERSYAADITHFARWCAELGVRPWPSSPEAVGTYLALELENGASYGALKRRFSAISYGHRIRDLRDPCRGADLDDADGDPRPFPAAVLMRARRQKQKEGDSSGSNNAGG